MKKNNTIHSSTRSSSEVLLSLLSFLFILTVGLSAISCDSGEEDILPEDENPEDSVITLEPVFLSQNQMLIGSDTLPMTNVGFGSGQVRGNVPANALDLGQIILFFANDDTGNGLNEPAAGSYKLIESSSGLVTTAGEVNMRITLANDVFNFYASDNSSGDVQVTVDGEGYVSYTFSNVLLVSTSASIPNLLVSANLGGNTSSGNGNTIQPTLGNIVLSDNVFAFNESVQYNTAGAGERNDFTFYGPNSTRMTIFFKSFTGIPNGTYNLVDGGPSGVFSSSFINNENTCQITIREVYITGGNDFGSYFGVKDGGQVKVSIVDAKIRFEFENVMMAHSTTSPLFPLSGILQY
ncbi:MAG: hypothetical protein RIC03_16200 [Cyclobacteriaceae bacterium]